MTPEQMELKLRLEINALEGQVDDLRAKTDELEKQNRILTLLNKKFLNSLTEDIDRLIEIRKLLVD